MAVSDCEYVVNSKVDIKQIAQQDIHETDSNAVECRQKCNEDDECMAFVYDDVSKKCVYTTNTNLTFTQGTKIWHIKLCGNHGIIALATLYNICTVVCKSVHGSNNSKHGLFEGNSIF